jgi:hypothetical protein
LGQVDFVSGASSGFDFGLGLMAASAAKSRD